MSIQSALVMERDNLPTVGELAAAVVETGTSVAFSPEFNLDRATSRWVSVQFDGETTGFEFSVEDLPEGLPEGVRRYGDTLLSFGARGTPSIEAVTAIQRVMAQRWNAAGWVGQELIPPVDVARRAPAAPDADSGADSEIKLDHSFVWRVEHTIGVILFSLALLGLILWNALA